MACCYSAPTISKPMLAYCHWIPRNKLPWNFNQNTKLFIHEITSENIICKIATIMSMGRWVHRFPNDQCDTVCTEDALPWRNQTVASVEWLLLVVALLRTVAGIINFTKCLTHWSQDKMVDIFPTTYSSALSWLQKLELQLAFHCSFFLRVQITIFQYLFR